MRFCCSGVLRRRNHLAPRHWHRAGAEPVHGVREDAALLHSHLEALEIVRCADRPPVVPEVTEAESASATAINTTPLSHGRVVVRA
jgi:hypothetical protein